MYNGPEQDRYSDPYNHEAAIWDEDEYPVGNADPDLDDIAEHERVRRSLAKEQQFIDTLEAENEEYPIELEDSEDPERKLLKRELQAQALKRLEDAARTQKDFENVIAWWDRLDANRQRKERYHELFRSGDDLPLDYGASEDALCFPSTMNKVLRILERKGDFIDSIFYSPYDIHELVTEEYLSQILRKLSDDYKFLLLLWALQQYSTAKIAMIREQTDRNIRKVRSSMLRKIRKKLLAVLPERAKKEPLTLTEKDFLKANGIAIAKTTE